MKGFFSFSLASLLVLSSPKALALSLSTSIDLGVSSLNYDEYLYQKYHPSFAYGVSIHIKSDAYPDANLRLNLRSYQMEDESIEKQLSLFYLGFGGDYFWYPWENVSLGLGATALLPLAQDYDVNTDRELKERFDDTNPTLHLELTAGYRIKQLSVPISVYYAVDLGLTPTFKGSDARLESYRVVLSYELMGASVE